jgi:hypothetical protein
VGSLELGDRFAAWHGRNRPCPHELERPAYRAPPQASSWRCSPEGNGCAGANLPPGKFERASAAANRVARADLRLDLHVNTSFLLDSVRPRHRSCRDALRCAWKGSDASETAILAWPRLPSSGIRRSAVRVLAFRPKHPPCQTRMQRTGVGDRAKRSRGRPSFALKFLRKSLAVPALARVKVSLRPRRVEIHRVVLAPMNLLIGA